MLKKIKSLYWNLRSLILSKIGRFNPELLVKYEYYKQFGRRINLDNPQTLNEKIQYLSLRTDTSLWTKCADKFAVRDYVTSCGLSDILCELYAHWTKMEEVNLETLPNQFVLKSVQGCGDIIICKNKIELLNNSLGGVIKAIGHMLTYHMGDVTGEPHYLKIKPAVICEQLLPIDDSIIDYKIWCFNGIAHYIMTCSHRFANGCYLGLYDRDWKYLPYYMLFSPSHPEEKEPLPRPENLKGMLEVAERLSKPFECVRVDLYNINGKIYFGELTFTSQGGRMTYYTEEFQQLAGSIIHLK